MDEKLPEFHESRPPGSPRTAEESSTAVDRLNSGQAWEDYCDRLRQAGRIIERFGNEITPLDRAEWYRYLSRLIRNSFERFIENSEPANPRLVISSWRTSINVTSPDQDHLMYELDPRYDFIIEGNRGTLPYFITAVWTWPEPADVAARSWATRGVDGLNEFNPAVPRVTASISSDDMDFDSNGNFVLRLSQKKQNGNWLPLAPQSHGILIRLVHHERAKERDATMRIRRSDNPKRTPVDADGIALGLARAGQDVLGRAEFTRVWWQDELGKRPNDLKFSQQLYLANGGVPDRQFAFAIWQKVLDETLVIEFTPPECEYWIFQLCNIWQENLDNYEDGQGYVTKFTARRETNGAVRLVIADADPGVGGNWVDSYRHTEGIMGLRLIKTKSAPQLSVHRLSLAHLKSRGWAALTKENAIVSGGTIP
jgi:hypothetical protein